jgi:hypothetical protein
MGRVLLNVLGLRNAAAAAAKKKKTEPRSQINLLSNNIWISIQTHYLTLNGKKMILNNPK